MKLPSPAACDAAAEMIRDLGTTMFCRACRVAYLPGTLRCRNCGGALATARKPTKSTQVKTEAA